jgi:uncharacterized membrane protein
MKEKTGRWIRFAIVVILGVLVGVGITLKIALIPLIAFPSAVLAMVIIRRSVKDRVKDERLIHMAEKAARMSFSIYGISSVAIGDFLIAFDKAAGAMYAIGYTLLFSTAFLSLLYFSFYTFYTKKY